MKESQNLLEGLLEEISRVSEMIIEYRSLPSGAGYLAAAFMELDIMRAETAISKMDAVQMIASYKALKEYES